MFTQIDLSSGDVRKSSGNEWSSSESPDIRKSLGVAGCVIHVRVILDQMNEHVIWDANKNTYFNWKIWLQYMYVCLPRGKVT